MAQIETILEGNQDSLTDSGAVKGMCVFSAKQCTT